MKLFVVIFLLPFVASECPPPPTAPITCQGSDLLCGGGPGPDGCPMPQWCKEVNPYAHCSNRASCPLMCGPDMMKCWGGDDNDGCPMPETCMPMPSSTAICPMTCPIMCGSDQIMCGGAPDANGCPMPNWCMDLDPKCPSTCPVDCGPSMMSCPGGTDWNGCAMPDTCMPEPPLVPAACPMTCPMGPCGQNEIMCGGQPGPNGCPMPMWCMAVDYTRICPSVCPTTCPPDMIFCNAGYDSMGCKIPETCHPMAAGCPVVPHLTGCTRATRSVFLFNFVNCFPSFYLFSIQMYIF